MKSVVAESAVSVKGTLRDKVLDSAKYSSTIIGARQVQAWNFVSQSVTARTVTNRRAKISLDISLWQENCRRRFQHVFHRFCTCRNPANGLNPLTNKDYVNYACNGVQSSGDEPRAFSARLIPRMPV